MSAFNQYDPNILYLINSYWRQHMRPEQQSYQLTIAQEQPRYNQLEEKKRVRHIYLEEENIYGRFVPYLLLKDQLQSQIDSSGTTALHHMCSYNSPYLPLFLSSIENGDSILNRKSKLGHTPLDVAGLYCSRQHIQMLKQKGAIDNGNVDNWAIQGGNPANWSGKIYPQNKGLIHWAAYNDMPQVIAQYAKQGISVSQPDSNGYSPVDLTVLNKSYNSLKVLTDLGERPKQQLIKTTDSLSIKQHFQKINQSIKSKVLKKILKTCSCLFFLVLCLLLNFEQINMAIVTAILFNMIHIMVKPTKAQRYMDSNRKTEFVSELFMNKIINRRNQFSYLIFHVLCVACGINSIYSCKIDKHYIALCCLVVGVYTFAYTAHLLAQVYGICRNLTYDELFYSHKWSHLWDKIKYIQERKFLIREFTNSEDKGVWQNFKDYLFY